MQFVKACRKVNLILPRIRVTGIDSRPFKTNVTSIRQRLSDIVRSPREYLHGHRITSIESTHTEQKNNAGAFVDSTNSVDHRRIQSADLELGETEDKLFNNQQRHQQDSNLSLSGVLQKYNCDQHEENSLQKTKRNKKRISSRYVEELGKETLNVLRPYSSKQKSMESFDSKRKLKYLKLNPSDSLYGDLRLLVTSRKRRDLKSKLVLEGKRLTSDGLEAGLIPDTILFTRLSYLDEIKFNKGARLIQVENHVLQEWSKLVTCPGVIGIFHHPNDMTNLIHRNKTAPPLPITIVCDNIREPNNLGSIIRSCAAIPVQNVVLLKGCAHPWDSKCLRGGAGAHFRINIIGPLAIGDLEEYLPSNAYFLAADNTVDRKDDSWAFLRYDEANFRDMQHVVLVIGGETYGISNDLRRFIRGIKEKSPHKDDISYNLHIPMANNIESLNTASAVSVLLYEIRRQMRETGKH